MSIFITKIKSDFDQKFNKKFKTSGKKKGKTGQEGKFKDWQNLEEISQKFVQNQILKELEKLTSLTKKLKKKLKKIERKMENK